MPRIPQLLSFHTKRVSRPITDNKKKLNHKQSKNIKNQTCCRGFTPKRVTSRGSSPRLGNIVPMKYRRTSGPLLTLSPGSILLLLFYWHINPPITRKRRSAVRACLGVAGHLSTTLRWRNSVKCLSQRHNK